jgi:Zn finger protein HypA/HybF involved in hydrogenase expression
LDFEVNENNLKPNPQITRIEDMENTIKTLECRGCGLFTNDEKIINKCITDDLGNYICPDCGNMAIVTEI